ncbi:hypothetical protein CROQUDRAFT_537448 [Cronartium quercuum f. sp. fusiforme G11]|uniref:Uncharacterized protein n=1 Tax=Cronartium quercuum f. sp. fusiforme G11 TaxID=708437 RepID=A0A9P6NXG1_9BASI|nr:hypothetical protein CROQUDRAFT_537448 [Cronartium quercuum f. sp. fusiforme G11]
MCRYIIRYLLDSTHCFFVDYGIDQIFLLSFWAIVLEMDNHVVCDRFVGQHLERRNAFSFFAFLSLRPVSGLTISWTLSIGDIRALLVSIPQYPSPHLTEADVVVDISSWLGFGLETLIDLDTKQDRQGEFRAIRNRKRIMTFEEFETSPPYRFLSMTGVTSVKVICCRSYSPTQLSR